MPLNIFTTVGQSIRLVPVCNAVRLPNNKSLISVMILFTVKKVEETIDYLSDSAPPPKKRKCVRRPTSQGTLVTKTFVLRKDSKGTQPSTKSTLKRRRKHSFKCIKCNKHCKSVRILNQHFKEQHRPLQCSKCNKFFPNARSFKTAFLQA